MNDTIQLYFEEVYPSKITLSDLDIYSRIVYEAEQDLVYTINDAYEYSLERLEEIINDKDLLAEPNIRTHMLEIFWEEVLDADRSSDNAFMYTPRSSYITSDCDLFNTDPLYYQYILQDVYLSAEPQALIGNGVIKGAEKYSTFLDGMPSDSNKSQFNSFFMREDRNAMTFDFIFEQFNTVFEEIVYATNYDSRVSDADTLTTTRSNIIFILKSPYFYDDGGFCDQCPNYDEDDGCSLTRYLREGLAVEGVEFVPEYVTNKRTYILIEVGKYIFAIDYDIYSKVYVDWIDYILDVNVDRFFPVRDESHPDYIEMYTEDESKITLINMAFEDACASCYIPEVFYTYLINNYAHNGGPEFTLLEQQIEKELYDESSRFYCP